MATALNGTLPVGITVATTTDRYRVDIQALRGVAVIGVLFYHSGLGLAPAGFLGVDVFFVISGFLITGIVSRAIEERRFSFARFYTRRARRLLPAGYVVLAATTAAAMWLLTSRQFELFWPNLAGSLLFSANYTLWSQTGYFHPASEFQPLLHMWSLAIEEQYYLLMPLALVLVPRRWWLGALAAVTLASLALSLALGPVKPGIAFYWLPPRAWELALGSLCALVAARPDFRRWAELLLWPALAGLAVALFIPLPGPQPGWAAVLACGSTALVILAASRRSDNAPVRLLARAGDISYSLYLVHWPLFALVRIARLEIDLPSWVSLLLIIVSVLLAALLYRWVEEPIRRSSASGRTLLAVGIGGALLIFGAAMTYRQVFRPPAAAAELTRGITGLAGDVCFSEDQRFTGACRQPGMPRILLWGDSHAAHVVPALVATSPAPIVQASRGRCSPLLGYAGMEGPHERLGAERCIAHTDQVLAYLRQQPSIEVVIISAYLGRTVAAQSRSALRRVNGRFEPAPLGMAPTLEAMRQTVAAVRAAGKRVVVIGMAPASEVDLGECWLRRAEGRPSWRGRESCQPYLDDSFNRKQRYAELFAGLEGVADVPVLRLSDALCPPAGPCRIEAEGRPLFRDTDHFTSFGSAYIGRRLNLGQRAWAIAR